MKLPCKDKKHHLACECREAMVRELVRASIALAARHRNIQSRDEDKAVSDVNSAIVALDESSWSAERKDA